MLALYLDDCIALKEENHASDSLSLSDTHIIISALKRDGASIQYLALRLQCRSVLVQTTISATTGSVINLVQHPPHSSDL